MTLLVLLSHYLVECDETIISKVAINLRNQDCCIIGERESSMKNKRKRAGQNNNHLLTIPGKTQSTYSNTSTLIYFRGFKTTTNHVTYSINHVQ